MWSADFRVLNRFFPFSLVLAAILSSCAAVSSAQQEERANLSKMFNKREVMIPVRDGVKLHSEIYTPKDAKEPLPMLLDRTPYGISAPDKGYSLFVTRTCSDGYIFVFQDIRGRYGSEGQFEMLHTAPDPGDPNAVTESTDTYDTIEWLVKNVPNNNGRVGMDGISYPGYLVTMGMVNPHPALKAVSEQACMCDTWLGDDFFHNGAFRETYGSSTLRFWKAPARISVFRLIVSTCSRYRVWARFPTLMKNFPRKIPT
jgi:predicted acyl esterase